MEVILHVGLHRTDNDELIKTLSRNQRNFRPEGIAVPDPRKYRTLLSDLLNGLGKSAPSPDTRDVLLDSILEDFTDDVDRLILSHENLFSVPKIAFQGSVVYRNAEFRLQTLSRIFEQDSMEIFIALRNPATLLPALLNTTPHDNIEQLLCGLNPTQIRWSELISRITTALPGVQLTVWCDEDSPLIWGELIRKLAGLEPDHPVIGALSRMAGITSKEGMSRFREQLKASPSMTSSQIKDEMIAHLDEHEDLSKTEYELDIPGWDNQVVDYMTKQYDDDVETIEQMAGVSLIMP